MFTVVEVDAEVLLGKLQRLAGERVASRRREIVQAGSRMALTETIDRTPVDEGEARSSWVTGLTLLGGTPPAGWEGGHPKGESLRAGSEAASVEQIEGSVQSEIQCRSDVEHVVYLEYGTRRMEPRASVQRSLAETAERIGEMEFLTAGMLQ